MQQTTAIRTRQAPRRRRRRGGALLQLFSMAAACLLAFACGRLISAQELLVAGTPAAPSEAGPAVPDGGTEDWRLKLVNGDHPLSEDFTVELTYLRNGQAVDARAYPDLQAMMDDARAAGLSPLICSSFRTWETQKQLYENKARSYRDAGYGDQEAKALAGKWVAVPGTSEHQLGLAVDIVSASYQTLDEAQEQTPEQQWLLENSWKYGFILRYPTEKSDVTSIHYEPWHYRYVGREAAREIWEQGVCLEEYLEP